MVTERDEVMSTRVIMFGLTLLVVLCGCSGPAIVNQCMPIFEDSHRVLLQKHEIICPIGQGTIFRSYFRVGCATAIESPGYSGCDLVALCLLLALLARRL